MSFTALIIFTLVIVTYSQKARRDASIVPWQGPPAVEVSVCGSRVITEAELPKAITDAAANGCTDIHSAPTSTPGYYYVYGIQIVEILQ